MSEPVVEIMDSPYHKAEEGIKATWFYCPGCKCTHAMDHKRWPFDGDLVTPTLSPSFITKGSITCHLFIRNGKIEFLSDCEHDLAGQTVAMEPVQ